MKRTIIFFITLKLFGFGNLTNLNAQIAPSVFADCRWIGGSNEDLPLYSHYLSVFKINYTVQILPPSLKEQNANTGGQWGKSIFASFIYGANDERLMNKYRNIYHIENQTDNSYIKIELAVRKSNSPCINPAEAELNIYRVGYTPEDKKNTPLKTVAVPLSLINQENKFKSHIFYIHSNSGITQIFIDGEAEKNLVVDMLLNPYGRGGDFFAFPVLADIGYEIPENQSAEFSNIEIRNFRKPSNLITNYELQITNNFETFNPSKNSMPLLRTKFSTKPDVKKAQLFITARGIYLPYINGKRVGNDYFNPGHTQYNKTHLYQIYDVAKLLQQGENELQVQLGEGWWSGAATYAPENWNFYGDRNSLLAKLVISYTDGTEKIVTTAPQTWEYSTESPVIHSSLFNGEVIDNSNVEIQTWKSAVEIPIDKNTANFDFSNTEFVPQFAPAIQPCDTLTAVSVEEVRPKVFVYDMGQNMVGVPRITFENTKAGQKIVMRYAEVKYPNLPEYKNNNLAGELMLENIRAAMAQDIFLPSPSSSLMGRVGMGLGEGPGGEVIFQPLFTYHGYRYIEITGIDNPLPISDVQGIVLSSINKFTAHYECSNPKVNRLWENIRWSMLGNFLSVPTDCPQRNERLGWSGDISVFAQTAVYMADVQPFLRQHLRAMRDNQRADGRFPDVAPGFGSFGGFLWGSAGITVAWENYRQYADTAALAEHYPAMKRYIDFVLTKYIDKETNILVQENPAARLNLGDWLGLEQERNDNSLIWEAYLLFELEIMKNCAIILNKNTDLQFFIEKYAERKSFFNETYIDRETKKTVCSGAEINRKNFAKGKLIDTQTSYALPLAFNIVNEEDKPEFIENFVATVTRKNAMDNLQIAPPYSLLTGFIGTAWISKALSENGHSDLAYRLLQQTAFPSWLYPIEQGATTIWERLNSYTHENGFGGNNSMNSFNHYSFGAVGAWMIENSLGIQICRDAACRVFLAPEPDPTGEMTFARGYYDSAFGRIESAWEIKNGETHYRFVVPQNTTAKLYLSGEKIIFKNKKGVKKLAENIFELKAGEHIITAKK